MSTAEIQIDRDAVWAMLQAIPACDRDIWIKIGMAVKDEFGDRGYSIFDEWSSTAYNYDPKAVRHVWRSFKGRGISIATLIQLSKKSGWTPDKPIKVSAPKPKRAPTKTQGNTHKYALELWMKADRKDAAVANHPYAIKKGIECAAGAGRVIVPYGVIVGKNTDCIIIPIRSAGVGKVQAVQCINSEGRKQTFGRLSDGYLLLGNTLDKSCPWYVCEGWASAYSMVFHHQSGAGVCAMSFGKSNLKRTAHQIAENHKPNLIRIYLEPDK